MTRPLTLILLSTVAAGAIGLWWLTRPTPIPVVLTSVESGRVTATVANTRAGTIEACRRARLSTPMGGQIARLPVEEGDRVEKDEVLCELWNDDARAQVALAEREIGAARARAVEACTMAEIAEKEAARVVRLHEQGVAAVEAVDKAVGEAKAGAARCAAARASSRVSEARLDAAQAALAKTILRAPFGGIVAEINGEVGEVVTPSPVGVATLPTIDLIDTSCLYVRAPIDEVDAGKVEKGLPAYISLDAFPGVQYPAVVTRVAPYVLDLEKQARTVDVEVEFRDIEEAGRLLVGYSADVEIILEAHEDTLRIPTEALLEGRRVLLYRDGVLAERKVEAGLENWESTEVLSGLEEGDRIVLTVDRDGVGAGASVAPEEPPATDG